MTVSPVANSASIMPPPPTPFYTKISGTGSYLPARVLTNADLEKMVDTNDAWITERTGIRERHIAAPDQVMTDLAEIAARRAIENAGLAVNDIDMIVVCTVSGEQTMPSSACNLQRKLGARPVMAFDLSAACSGFIYGSTIADQFIRTGVAKHVLVVGAEILHRYTDYKDRETCILFGDGAGAVVYSRTEDVNGSRLLSSHMRADGNLGDLLVLINGGSGTPPSPTDQNLGHIKMKGREIFKHAVRSMSLCCEAALDALGMTSDQVDWLIPHQANLRIIEAVGSHFGIDPKRVIVNVSKTGNTSAASVPIALDEAVRSGQIQRGQVVLLTAFGGGLTAGSLLMRY